MGWNIYKVITEFINVSSMISEGEMFAELNREITVNNKWNEGWGCVFITVFDGWLRWWAGWAQASSVSYIQQKKHDTRFPDALIVFFFFFFSISLNESSARLRCAPCGLCQNRLVRSSRWTSLDCCWLAPGSLSRQSCTWSARCSSYCSLILIKI